MLPDKLLIDIPLHNYTSIGLGGPARYFYKIASPDELQAALGFAVENHLDYYILGSGSNCIFADAGYDGLILFNDFKGIEFVDTDSQTIIANVAGGENWDEFVKLCCQKGLSGLECLSGIPGTVGAVPVQNVGAYGQEVSDCIDQVQAIHLETGEPKIFSNAQCRFAYRNSLFKDEWAGQYFISKVSFKLEKDRVAEIKYAELKNRVADTNGQTQAEYLLKIRENVILLRKTKSMVLDSQNPNTKSCGSFFMNPVISLEKWEQLQNNWNRPDHKDIPNYPAAEGIKVSAAFLIEQSGFHKGHRHKGVGISSDHALALVNYGGTTAELIELKDAIQSQVLTKFGIALAVEPNIIQGAL